MLLVLVSLAFHAFDRSLREVREALRVSSSTERKSSPGIEKPAMPRELVTVLEILHDIEIEVTREAVQSHRRCERALRDLYAPVEMTGDDAADSDWIGVPRRSPKEEGEKA